MKTITLYRPIGIKELELIIESGHARFPPRLEWQPIFYPVMNEGYAIEICVKWNTTDEFSGYIGFVTAFQVDAEYLKKFEVQNVGGTTHNELWVPAEEMEVFNDHIIGTINVTKTYIGPNFKGSENEVIKNIIKTTKVNIG
ncbi:ADP-ribosylation/crystallin J1 [Aureisphaera galaxeae]|uniref:ADP-ribosylation/crystallin J1 n=1 Tax=Aureisphaera galaxeae TaxID=1538023 RepID=UPI0023500708|nr:ADP-ribosylation/crystallin J1 [Aureisphaera galaxeae]MDC8004323.1 ADP-ribosylation/crystallin J1 [Aureisphaera galaxeae]